ncbi:uncharacterized protein [Panulirus ornatus]|uniref:uncharacterized protein n=1 Tax=Panulirus ornatus TaxID=150431 RepID=UPI003A83DCE2
MGDADEQLLRQRKDFWDHQDPTLEAMIQTKSQGLADDDADEVMAYLPDLRGKRVIDLAAGIGRFTTRLAKVASQVTAVDVAEAFIKENRARNQHLGNVSFICSDVVKLDFPEGSFDLVFSNWLLKYLSNAELIQFLSRVLKWLSPGGFFFFRESCYNSVGTLDAMNNPTVYHKPQFYLGLLRDATGDDQSSFRLVRSKSILVYINHKNAPNQVCFLAEKVSHGDVANLKEPQCRLSSLDAAALEKAFRGPCLTMGGTATTRDFCGRLGLRAGQRVLDVGCGTGASAVFMARHLGVHVHGVDLSPSRVFTAIERQMNVDSELRKKLQFEMRDVLSLDCEEDTYHAIHVRDTLHKFTNKKDLFVKFCRWLRPGGTIFVTDYCKGGTTPSQHFLNHVQQIQPCSLDTAESHEMWMREAGLKGVTMDVLGQEFIKILQNDLNVLASTCGDSDEDKLTHKEVTAQWTNQLKWVREGYITWASFVGSK